MNSVGSIDFSKIPIRVGYIYRNADSYLLNNIYDLNGKKLNDLNDLYKLINILLHDIIDIIVKNRLKEIKNLYKYQIFGGKAFEKIMNPLYNFVSSFDFDIEVINEYANKISIINTEKQTHDIKYQEKIETNISNKYGHNPLHKSKLPNLNVSGLYSESERQMPMNIQIGALNNKNNKYFYHKYLKYKLKYLMLNNKY
jgi:hypothetical protein